MATPNTSLVGKRFANGIVITLDSGKQRFYPYRSVVVTAPGAMLTASPSLRVYVKDITLSYATLGTDTGTEITVTGVVDGVVSTLAGLYKTASVVNIGSQTFPVGVLLDKSRVPTLAAADISTVGAVMTYAASDDTV